MKDADEPLIESASIQCEIVCRHRTEATHRLPAAAIERCADAV